MNIPAVNGQLGDLPAARNQPHARPTDRPTADDGAAAPGVAAPLRAEAPTALRQVSTLGLQAPPGTDPALWSILTTEERTFFSRQALSGPLTYLKVMMPNAAPMATAAARGRRLDVRV